MGFSRQENWSGLPFPSPGDLSNPEIEPKSPALPADYQLSHKGSPRRLTEWVAYPFSSRPSHPGIQPGSPGLQSDSLPIELSRKPICLQRGRPGFNPWVQKSPWRRESQPTPVFLPGESHGQRNLVGFSPWARKELDMTE